MSIFLFCLYLFCSDCCVIAHCIISVSCLFEQNLKLQSLIYISFYFVNRGSYISAHVLLNLFNELRKRDKMRGLPSILSLFRNEFNKCNKTRERKLDIFII